MTSLLIAVLFSIFGKSELSRSPDCLFFDNWLHSTPFEYAVSDDGNWNFPSDAEISDTIMFPDSGIWKYYSEAKDTTYVIVYLSFEVTGPPYGNHRICVSTMPGYGL